MTPVAVIPPALQAILGRYAALLLKWNAKINLTAAASVDDAMHHIADCMAVVGAIPNDTKRLVDVGSGGGLPAVVIAAALPEVEVVAVEPTNKKHAFLRTASRELALPNLRPVPARIEDFKEREFDVATSRATFALDEWLRRGSELVRAGGLVIGMEGVVQVALDERSERIVYELAGKTRALVIRRC
jgi:16S rRNA (guanine527-N7)-methyltransferase